MDGSVLLDSFLALVAFFWLVLPAGIFAMAMLVSRRAPAPTDKPDAADDDTAQTA